MNVIIVLFWSVSEQRLLTYNANDFAPNLPFNLSINTPPMLEDPSWAIVRILKNDGAEGMVEFGGKAGQIKVHEESKEVKIPLVKRCFSFLPFDQSY